MVCASQQSFDGINCCFTGRQADNMDTTIVIFSFATFILYIILQIVVFRIIHPDRALIWLIKLYCIVEGAALLIEYGLWNGESYSVMVCWQATIFTLMTALYIISVFGFTEASITLRILTEIAARDTKGTTKKDIWKRYNMEMIVRRRLSRFLAGGEVRKKGSLYEWKNSVSPFIVREFITMLIRLLFGNHNL